MCRHCHADQHRTGGAAGAGNTGGFGYAGKGLDLSTEKGIKKGVIDPVNGARRSVIGAATGEYPLIVSVLIARHNEASGEFSATLRGMPLGLPPIPEDDIRLLLTWCRQQ